MSGPKLILVLPFAPALPLVPALLIAAAATAGTAKLVNLTSSYLQRRKLEERFRRVKEDFNFRCIRFRALGVSADQIEETLEELSRAADELMQEDHCEKAIALFANAIQGVEMRSRLLETSLELRVSGLQRRFHDVSSRVNALAAALKQLESFAHTATPADWPAAERARVEALCRDAIAGIIVPDTPDADLSEAGVKRLKEAEAMMAEAERALGVTQQTLQSEINRAQTKIISAKLGIAAKPAAKLADWLALQPASAAKSGPVESGVLKKLDALLAQIGMLQDTAGWTDLMRRADAVRAESDGTRRRRLYESLVLESGKRLKQLRAAQKWTANVDLLLEEAAPYGGTAVDAVVAGLRDLRRAGRPVDLAPWRERLTEIQQRELARLERERKRQAILESLNELGYEMSEGMGTALAQAGKVIVRKPGDDDYAVELVSNADLSMVQTSMVRYSDSPELTEQQRRRDCEREEEWCADHASLREHLAKQGLGTSFKLKLPSGGHPVKVVQKDKRPAAGRAARRLQQRTA